MPGRMGMRAICSRLVASAGLSWAGSSNWIKANPVTPWKPRDAKVVVLTGAFSFTAMRTSTLPRVWRSSSMAVTRPTITPL